MQSIIQVLKVNDLKSGTSKKTGQPYEMQDAECLLLDDAGAIQAVGVLDIPKSLRDVVKPGTFTASFGLRRGIMTGKIEAVLTGLTPVPAKAQRSVA